MDTLFNQISEAIRPIKSIAKLKNDSGKITVEYISNSNPEIIIEGKNLFTEDGLKKKLELAGYTRKEVDKSLKNQLKKAIFGDVEFNVQTVEDIRKTSKLFNDIVKELTILTEPKKGKTAFQIEKAAAQAKIQNVKSTKNKSITLEQAKAELLAVYEKYGEPYRPRGKKDAEPTK